MCNTRCAFLRSAELCEQTDCTDIAGTQRCTCQCAHGALPQRNRPSHLHRSPQVTRGETAHILYFGNDWFAENRTSSNHVVRWLAQRQTVYYIEYPGLRAPKGSGRDLRKIGSKLLRFLRGPRSVEGGVKLWTVVQIPLHRFGLVRRLNRWLIRSSPPA